jgi:glycosyltransferase involved in cell wall biosynthesis
MDLESQIRHVHGPEGVAYAPDELVVVCLVQDGRPYLRSFVEHYLSLGAKHLVFMDNGSTDGTVEALKAYGDNVTVLQTGLPFEEYQKYLKQYLVTRFGRGRWVLYVDIDELFDYPYSDVVGLSSFLRYLTGKSYTAVVAQMLDMFPEKPPAGRAGEPDESLKELHRFYDISNITRQSYYSRGDASNTVASEEIEVHRDGIHRTVFGHSALLTKHPLMFLDEKMRPVDPGPHWVGGARVADITCVLFHYKFTADFYERVVRNVEEESYVNDSAKYKKFLETLERDSELYIKRETAQELKHVNDLVDNQFLVVSRDYMVLVDAEERKSVSNNDIPEGDEPRRLAEAFSKASAEARTQARVARLLKQQVEILEGRFDKWDDVRLEKRKNARLEKRKNARLEKRKNARLERLKRLTKENRSLVEENHRLKSENNNLRRQLQAIADSRGWRMLDRLGRIRARVLPRKGR